MEFLFENPIVIAMIIGIISTIFSKLKGVNENQKNKPKQRQASNQQPAQQMTNHDPYLEARKIEEASYEQIPGRLENEYIERKKQAEAKLQAMQQQQAMTEKRARSLKRAGLSSRMESDQIESSKRNTLSADKQKIVDGVIWSEILGPPRALNPHRSVKGK